MTCFSEEVQAFPAVHQPDTQTGFEQDADTVMRHMDLCGYVCNTDPFAGFFYNM